MPFLSLIGEFLVKLLGSGIFAPVLAYLGKRSGNGVLTNSQNVIGDVTVAQAQLTAYVEEQKVLAAERAKLAESKWTNCDPGVSGISCGGGVLNIRPPWPL